MIKEIKEILNCIDNNVKNYYVGTNGCLYQDLTKEQLLLIKNYITNLQKENEKLKRELKSKPDNEITLETKDGQIMTIIQSERIDMQEKLNKSLNNAIEKYLDYKQRNEKAIEYIKNNKDKEIATYGDDYDYETCLFKEDIDDLLNILKGGDE